MSKHGPFDRYTEVDTEHGTFGVPPGVLVSVDITGVHPVADEPEPGPDPYAVPDGNVDEVLDWVGDDVDRAVEAHEAESESRHPRVTLLAALEELIGGDDDAEEEADDDEASDSDEASAQADHPSAS